MKFWRLYLVCLHGTCKQIGVGERVSRKQDSEELDIIDFVSKVGNQFWKFLKFWKRHVCMRTCKYSGMGVCWLTKLTLFCTSLHPPYTRLISSFGPFIPQILLHFHIFTQIFSKLLRYDNSLISFDLMFKCHFLKDLWLIYFCSVLWFLQHTLTFSSN